MPLIYLTGLSGSGKSTLRRELQSLGYEAHGVDEEGYADWVNRHTGQIDAFPHDDLSLDIHQWHANHDWVLSATRISELASQASGDQPVFLCGVASGDEQVWHKFHRVIALVIDESTLRQRVAQREGNEFGQRPEELAEILRWHAGYAVTARRRGAIVVDANQPVQEVVQRVLAAAGLGQGPVPQG